MDNSFTDHHTSIWSRARETLKETLPGHAYSTWFEPIKSIALNENELVLEVPNQFFFEWIESHYKTTIREALYKEVEKALEIKYTVSTEKERNRIQNALSGDIPQTMRKKEPSDLNKHYQFSSYIEGSNNQFAKAAAMSVAETPGEQAFNPLIVYGGVGLGKTHLLHAIGNQIVNTKPELGVKLASSEKFTLDFISSIQKNRTVEFSRHYRKFDVLLIDDIQFFQKKEQTQEQFFHTFNELYQSGKQIVLTADRYPGEMVGLQDRLLSRFKSGLSVDIQPPNFETRVAILLEKADQNGLSLPYDIIEFMATYIKSNVRELESTIIRLLAYSSLAKCEIDRELVKKVIKERLGSQPIANITVEDVVRGVSEATRIGDKDIVGPSRRKQIVEARQIAMLLCRDILNTSLVNTGMFFGGRDHTTVLHAVRTIERRSQDDTRLKNLVLSIKQNLTFSLT